MKKQFIFITLILLSNVFAIAQSASWIWGKADVADIAAINFAPRAHVAAAGGNKVLWAQLRNYGLTADAMATTYMGRYLLTEYDTLGNITDSAEIGGNVLIYEMHADAAGNWYVLGEYHDSAAFPGGTTLTADHFAYQPTSFIARINAGSHTTEWAKVIGTVYSYFGTTFTATQHDLYLVIDSSASAPSFSSTVIKKYDINTGADTYLYSQSFYSYVTSIAADNAGNVYLAGSCVDGVMNFRGHIDADTAGSQREYIVKYYSNGDYAWHYSLSSYACPGREINIAGDSIIYYSGLILGPTTMGTFPIHHPAYGNGNIVVGIDSTGSIEWLTQLSDTISGFASTRSALHAVVMADGSLSTYTYSKGYIDWGNGVISNPGSHVWGSVQNYAPNGTVNWVKNIEGTSCEPTSVVISGDNIWVTGNVTDSTAYQEDDINVPVVPGYSTPFLAMLRTSSIASSVPAITNPALQFTVYPIPATSTIFIGTTPGITETVHIKLTDIAGRIVLDKLMDSGKGQLLLPVGEYNRGIYFISLTTTGSTMVKKVILE